jgi:hypothetical protein
MSYQEQEKPIEDVSSSIYIGKLPNGDLYFGTEPPAGGFATDAGEAGMEEFPVLAVEKESPVGGFATDAETGMEEQQNPLSMLPQDNRECFDHPMWNLSKKCVVCGEPEFAGIVKSNQPLFNKFNCNFIRACQKHHAMVSSHFAKPEFNQPIDKPFGLYHEIRRCIGCGNNFSTMCDSQNSFCDKGCQGNWLDRRFG